MTLNHGAVRENHVVEVRRGGLIAWCPAEPAAEPFRVTWALGTRTGRTRECGSPTPTTGPVTDPKRLERARAARTRAAARASMDRLAAARRAVPDQPGACSAARLGERAQRLPT